VSTEEKAKAGAEKGAETKGTPEEEAEKARKQKEEENKKPAASG
jgi:hypothetical protein